MLTRSEALKAQEDGAVLMGSPIAVYPGEVVEYLPREDEANGHPDYYAWHVVGRPDSDRMNVHQLVVKE